MFILQWIIKNFDVVERSLSPGELPLLSELFVSNTVNGVIPVQRVDGYIFNNYTFSTPIQKKLINSC